MSDAVSCRWVLAAFGALGWAASAAGQEPLRWQLQAGDALRWEAQQTVQSQRKVTGRGKPPPALRTAISMTLRWRWDVVSSHPTHFAIRQTLESLQLTMNAGDGTPLEYDSTKPENSPESPAIQQLSGPLAAWLNKPVPLQLGVHGRLETDKSDDASDASDASDAPDTPVAILALTRGVLPRLPVRAVRLTDRWQDQRRESTAAGELRIRRTFQLQPPRATDDAGQVQIAMAGALSLQPAQPPAQAPFQLQRQSLSGKYVFDVQRGRLLQAKIKQHLATRRNFREQGQVETTTTISELSATCSLVSP